MISAVVIMDTVQVAIDTLMNWSIAGRGLTEGW